MNLAARIDSNDYYLNFVDLVEVVILGFTEDLERAKASLKDYKLEVVYQF
jgi:mevalonate kinase